MPGAIAEHPLTHGLVGQHFIYQQSCTVCHSACPTTGAKATGGELELIMNKYGLHDWQ